MKRWVEHVGMWWNEQQPNEPSREQWAQTNVRENEDAQFGFRPTQEKRIEVPEPKNLRAR